MKFRISCVTAAAILVVFIGCQGGRQDLPVSENGESSPETFIFAESTLMNIDSEMMSKKLVTIQLPGAPLRLDSAMAMKAVYSILADSFLARDAKHFDLEAASPTLYKQYLDLRRDRILRQMYNEIVADSVDVTDSIVRQLYDENKESFYQPDRYRARHIVISGEGLRYSDDSLTYKDMSLQERDSAAYRQLEKIRQRVLDGDNFDTLAMLYSQDDNTREVGGDLGFFQVQQMVHPFDSAVEHTDVGDISGIIKTQYGWHLIKVVDFDSAHYLPLDSVYDQIANTASQQMLMEKSRQFIDSLRETADMVYDTAALNMPDSVHQPTDVMGILMPGDTTDSADTIRYTDYRNYATAFKRYNNITDELTFEQKKDIILSAAVQPMLMQAARNLGYFERPEIVEWSNDKLQQYSMSILRSRLTDSLPEPTEEEIQQYYDNHIDDFQVERPVSVQHIVFEDSAVAEYVRDLLMSGIDFMDMVDQYYPGDPDIKRAAADLGAIGPDDMPTPFYEAAMRTPVGSISHAVKTKYGYHLIKVLDRRYSRDLEQAKIKIVPLLKQQEEREALRRYVEAHLDKPPKIHWEYVDRLDIPRRPRPPTQPPPISGSDE